jgi:hypothetical protein
MRAMVLDRPKILLVMRERPVPRPGLGEIACFRVQERRAADAADGG